MLHANRCRAILFIGGLSDLGVAYTFSIGKYIRQSRHEEKNITLNFSLISISTHIRCRTFCEENTHLQHTNFSGERKSDRSIQNYITYILQYNWLRDYKHSTGKTQRIRTHDLIASNV